MHRAGAAMEGAQLGLFIVEQVDAERLAEISGGSADAQPRRNRLVPADHQAVRRGPVGDRLDRGGIGAVLGAEIGPGHIGPLVGHDLIEGRQIGQVRSAPDAQGQLDPLIGIGPPDRFRTGRQGVDAVGQGHLLCVRHGTSFQDRRRHPPRGGRQALDRPYRDEAPVSTGVILRETPAARRILDRWPDCWGPDCRQAADPCFSPSAGLRL